MSKLKRHILLLPLTALAVGLSLTCSLQIPLTAYSQQDYEEYIITGTNTEQKLNHKNVGSGSSTNLNCGTNIVGSDSTLTCQSIPGENSTPVPGTTVMPVVTQRVANVSTNPVGTTSGEAQCNPDEVVTGGGYSFSEISSGTGGGGGDRSLPPPTVYYRTSFKSFAQNNAWHIEIVNPNLTGNIQVYAECLKLVPA
jgi:hypothetical protein